MDGIPCFADPEYYWGEIPKELMQETNRLAGTVGWRAAVEQSVQFAPLRDYIVDPSRADFQNVWRLPENSSILDIGAGWGTIVHALGRHFRRVVAVEGVLERARFIRTRVRQENLPVDVICAGFDRLPLAPAQFDAVVLNGVLEWSAMGAEGDPREVQVNFLRRVRELLKPSGFVCLGIENRIGLAALRGSSDHSGLPWTSLMPRRLASWYCRRHAGYRSDANVGYRTYTYSLPGYRRLFREAGYGAVKVFHAWHGYNKPTVLLPVENPNALMHFARTCNQPAAGTKGRIKAALMRAAARTGIWGQCASEFIFLMERQ